MRKILGFTDDYRFMSNFVPVWVVLDGAAYRSVEHAYQAAKTIYPDQRVQVACAPTAGKAKRLGQQLTIRDDWEDVKLGVMEALLRQKFANDPFKSGLLATEDAYIEETNTWGDIFWGVCNGIGENHLGQLLMKLRAELGNSLENA